MSTQTTQRSVREIAFEISKVWKNPYFGAVPYIQALKNIDDSGRYGFDSQSSLINYFLANAATFRGEDAKRIKAELKKLV